MKKILIGILGTAACMAALLVNVSLTNNESSMDTNLVKLSVATEVNAECNSTPINNGRCSYFNNCYANPGGPVDCDTTKGN